MGPLTLIRLVTTAGLVFKKLSSQAIKNNENNREELTYSKDIVKRAKYYKKANYDIEFIDVLPEYKLVKELVVSGFPITFVTGGAGTGKSTFVKWILNEFDGSILLGAPTAVAALNIGGKTLHSLCQLPPAFIIKKDIKIISHKKEITEAKLLVIDEISMVNANLLDGVSYFFRVNRGVDKPFGGMPVVFVGDMFQLPPVISENTRDLFERIYGTGKFYNAKALTESPYYAIELKKTYRQNDQSFVNILTKIREGVDLEKTLSELNSKAKITDSPPEGSVWLSPRVAEVNSINLKKLSEIQSNEILYTGKISDKFKPDRLPSPIELKLKCGAQVMFTVNDPAKRWINGSVGKVVSLNDESIVVSMEGTNTLVDVTVYEWVDYKYNWNQKTREINRDPIGFYEQFPLDLAWAVTIHKSQGRTIEKVHLDLGSGAFETGQTYVALSRCRSIKGLSMARKLRKNDIIVDYESKRFYEQLRAGINKVPPDKMEKNITDSRKTLTSNNTKEDNKYDQVSINYKNGSKYVGDIKDGKRHGQGTYTTPKGSIYVGEFKNNKRDGYGTFTMSNGDQYVGEWTENMMNGQGTFTHSNGAKYIGERSNNKMSGRGTFIYSNGTRYVGDWLDNKKNGQGTLTYLNGSKYTGDFKHGKPWNGTKYDMHDNILQTYLNGVVKK